MSIYPLIKNDWLYLSFNSLFPHLLISVLFVSRMSSDCISLNLTCTCLSPKRRKSASRFSIKFFLVRPSSQRPKSYSHKGKSNSSKTLELTSRGLLLLNTNFLTHKTCFAMTIIVIHSFSDTRNLQSN